VGEVSFTRALKSFYHGFDVLDLILQLLRHLPAAEG